MAGIYNGPPRYGLSTRQYGVASYQVTRVLYFIGVEQGEEKINFHGKMLKMHLTKRTTLGLV
jgi:hypothetical protein